MQAAMQWFGDREIWREGSRGEKEKPAWDREVTVSVL
jgi:hypothetical protein